MKIISKYHDYYDSVLRHGQDFSLIYKREKIEIPDKQWFFSFKTYQDLKNHNSKPELLYVYTSYWSKQPLEYSSFLIGFCGKIYPGISWTFTPGNDHSKRTSGVSYDINYVFNLMEMAGVDHNKSVRKNRDSKWRDDYERMEAFFNQETKFLDRIFFDYKVPTFSIDCPTDYYGREGTFTLNDKLKEYEFQSIVPHLQAFQQIEQYLSGVIGADGPVLYELNNEEKITKAGFDKWSFRKLPSKKR